MLQPFHLPTRSGDRFCIFHAPDPGSAVGQGIVYAHPFAEEMNKSRRMAALQSRRFAERGVAVLQIDLNGCGDSPGEFSEARWELWRDDLRAGIEWLRPQVERLSLWGLRLGGALAAEVARDASLSIDRLLLWNPVCSGEQHLTQFLRLRVAAGMIDGQGPGSGVRGLRERLTNGESLEIAGYDLSPALAAAVDRVRIAETVPRVAGVLWIDVVQTDGLPPASVRAIGEWRAAGVPVEAVTVMDAAYWSTVEIVESDALLGATDGFAGGAA